ncbi:DUF1963 domain-containing protein [Streptomyces sp. t39]|uniref:DUF1963 domain-containing protein n=1 Tax=Streptomyces sp. t39 TaxID=1828156 RepID=UPI0011CD39B5|nr:DUF1963 domain-containing protein [Streptomyces sp. t39]TXS56216.1 DUF1963 domain-containing protein [Streptomyces sp. t39]
MTDHPKETGAAGVLGRFRAEAASRGLPSAEVAEWIRTVLPMAGLADRGEGVAAGRFGGDPPLPPDAPDPSSPFVASVDCAALPPGAAGLPLPSDGHLLFFVHPDLDADGPDAGAVRYVPAGTPTVPRRWDGDREPFEERALFAVPGTLSPQRPEDFVQGRWSVPELSHYALARRLDDAWQDAIGGEDADGGPREDAWFRLGGNPLTRNTHPVRYAAARSGPPGEGVDDWVLLAAWLCGSDVEDLDDGVVHWVIPRRDLAALRFDRVQVHVEI